MEILAARLRSRRADLGRTQQWVADRLTVDRTTYTKYESGRIEPSLEGLCQLATVLECSTDWLLGRE